MASSFPKNCSRSIHSSFLIITIFCGAPFLAAEQNPEQQQKKISGAALVIGDGVSLELLTGARVFHRGVQQRLATEKLPHTAIVRTWSANNVVTDSAAAATAFALGVKANNATVGIPPEGAEPGENLLDIAKSSGWSVAVITDDSVTGGTPAAFFVEHPVRTEHAQIAAKTLDRLGSRVDMLLGGGRQWFFKRKTAEYSEGEPEIVAKTQQRLEDPDRQVSVFTRWLDFVDAEEPPLPVLGLFHDNVFPYIADAERTPTLLDMVKRAVQRLAAGEKPMLLIIEASLPDKASHLNQANRALREVLEMDRVVAYLDETLSEDSLLVVTPDHGTGGFTLNGYLPLNARGPLLLSAHPVSGMPFISWTSGPGAPNPQSGLLPQQPAAEKITDRKHPRFAQEAAFYLESAAHTAGDVWLAARGPGAEKFDGFIENTRVYEVLKQAIQPEED